MLQTLSEILIFIPLTIGIIILQISYFLNAKSISLSSWFNESYFILIYILLIIFIILSLKNYDKPLKTDHVMQNEIIYKFSDEDLYFKTINGESKYKWNDFFKVVENKKFILFYLSSNTCFILPKRVIIPDELKELKQIIASKLEKNKNKLT